LIRFPAAAVTAYHCALHSDDEGGVGQAVLSSSSIRSKGRVQECQARTHTLLPFTAVGAAADDASRALQNLHPNSPHPEKKTLLRVTAAAAAVAVAFTDTVSRDALALSSFGSFYSLPRNHPVVNHHLKVIKPPLPVCLCVCLTPFFFYFPLFAVVTLKSTTTTTPDTLSTEMRIRGGRK